MFPDSQNPQSRQPQQNASGQYTVVPALPPTAHNAHSGHNPYEFIMNHNAAPKRMFWQGNGFALRIGLLVGGAAVIITIIAVVAIVLTPTGSIPGMTSMASRQQEIIRIADAAGKKGTSQDMLNFAASVEASVLTDKQRTMSFVLAHGGKLGAQTLDADRSTATDDLLQNAAGANTYDSAVVQNLTEQLQDYQTLVSNTYKQTSNKQAKSVLQSAYNSTAKLLEQAEFISTTD